MTIYVSELPKSCSECEFNWCDRCKLTPDLIYRNCPLQSISDYTKQVRKEVCEEIREKSYKDSELYDLPSGGISERSTYLINEHILDQIQGE